MVLRKINNLIVIFIILCSTSFFELSMLGPLQRGIELLGIFVIIGLLLLYMVYDDQKDFKHHFNLFLILIFLSSVTGLFMAYYDRDQGFVKTLYAERAIYYYLFYFLLHKLKVNPRDLEKIFIFFGILHIILYLLQYFAYPRIFFDAYILAERGTIRIYLAGGDYLAICYYMAIQAFLRTNKPRYMLYTLLSSLVFILQGGRATIGLMLLILILAILFSKKVKSRVLIGGLMGLCVLVVFFMFQKIFTELFLASGKDVSLGSDYVRIKAALFFLTDFFTTPLAYITGNGMYSSDTAYGQEISNIVAANRYYISDIGIIGNYVVYGIFFVIGVIGIIFRVFKLKLGIEYSYIKYMFIGACLSVLTSGVFAQTSFICFVCCLLYIVDVSQFNRSNQTLDNPDSVNDSLTSRKD